MCISFISSTHHVLLEDARRRLRDDIDADLSDIAVKLYDQNEKTEKRIRSNILCTWFVGCLYNYDYERAKRALTKCITLEPDKPVDPQDADKLLMVLWQSCKLLFKDDFSALFDEIERVIETNKAFDEDGINQPFV